ncbi:MAG: class I SAM-dependent methyltransferase [Lachnospiraceae bacterium]|nr:class I SAM-dependent methyltransferase [Lachnospiraceae bacterium]
MTISSKELEYYQTEYSKFWVNQTKVYGFGKYERFLTKLIAHSNPTRVFEVGIGTGWPIGAALHRKNIHVNGCDVAVSSVKLARETLKNQEGIYTGTIMDYTEEEMYDVTYCVRVSWYINNFQDTLTKMIHMTKPNGYIVFDIMDKYSLCCTKHQMERMKETYYRLLGIKDDFRHYGTHFYSIPAIDIFLRKQKIVYKRWSERTITGNKDIFTTPKIVYLCRKVDS